MDAARGVMFGGLQGVPGGASNILSPRGGSSDQPSQGQSPGGSNPNPHLESRLTNAGRSYAVTEIRLYILDLLIFWAHSV